ncbi:uracil-DNA glycosylase, partial [Patescibacteria group bacterium]|nr:uracil-DNA glycosylase [Patescibacteria group bacterium]
VRTLQESRGEDFYIPWFDPFDGGVNAKILLVGEAPGGKASGTTSASGFVSTDNNDPTAENMFVLRERVGLERSQLVHWNIVPWYVGSGMRISRPNTEMLKNGAKELEHVLKSLTKLQVIILLGKTAQTAFYKNILNIRKGIKIFDAPHPSQQGISKHLHPGNKRLLILALKKAKIVISNKKH